MDSNRSIKLGKILEGKLKGKKIILSPRVNLKRNEYLVESMSPLGQVGFSLHCLACEKQIPNNGCDKVHT